MTKKISDAQNGADAIKEFMGQFGTHDVYTSIFLETLFEELFKSQSIKSKLWVKDEQSIVCVPGETGQKGSTSPDHPGR